MQNTENRHARVWVPPDEIEVPPPIVSRPQTLPLTKLRWELFEQLSARLAQRDGDVEFCQRYGTPGQSQEGIDIYVRRRESAGYTVWQCKKYSSISSSVLRKAVTKFLSGSWKQRADEFVFATSADIEDSRLAKSIELEAQRLAENDIKFFVFGSTQISERLRKHPDLIDDFFGRDWVREFCGAEAADALSGRKLTRSKVIRMRHLLRRCYTEHFQISDPGLPSLAGLMPVEHRPLTLMDRFVPPEVIEERHVLQTNNFPHGQSYDDGSTDSTLATHDRSDLDAQEGNYSPVPERPRLTRHTTELRLPAIEWLSKGRSSIVLGEPGIGKSTLLRCVLLDLLSDQPRYESCAMQWGHHLPVWVPFAMWTRLVDESEACSLADVLTTWLHKVSAPVDLSRLVCDALDDSRLMLFVDGLDEWTNETAARSTLALLEQFVRERSIPAIGASRPLGYARLGGFSTEWRKATLTGLNNEQQRELTEKWFIHRSLSLQASRDARAPIGQVRARKEASEHIQDIHRDTRLSRLARIPLLLSGLIALSFQHLRLPRSRFKAYEELTRLLVEEQPRRREKASYARQATRPLASETRERALAKLAWDIHATVSGDAIDNTSAEKSLTEFCADYLRKGTSDSLETARDLLEMGSKTVGILVEKSPTDIGFPHRVFQEFLAARHLSHLPFRDQKKAFADLFGSAQWHDVLLCLCHLTTRADEVDQFAAIVQELDIAPDLEIARSCFLAEIAFGDLHCTVDNTVRIAQRTLDFVETGIHESSREQLIPIVVQGLESDTLRTLVANRITTWFPCLNRYRSGLYEVAATWEPTEQTFRMLWRGLRDDASWHQRAAAESLAKVLRGNGNVAEQLLDLLLKPSEPRLMAYALHALCLGWGQDQRLTQILADARYSPDASLKSVALIHRVLREEHDQSDRTMLLALLRIRFSAHPWRQELCEALVSGWPQDAEIKRLAISSISERFPFRGRRGSLDTEAAGPILLRGYAGDDDVAAAVAKRFDADEFPQHSIGIPFDWTPLVEAFQGHPILASSVDHWLTRRQKDRNGRYRPLFLDLQLCLVSRSATAKNLLLRPSENTDVISRDQAHWLLHGWGMQDSEAENALKTLATSEHAASIADLLPMIVNDKHTCLQLLAELLKEEKVRLSAALKGLSQLRGFGFDGEVDLIVDTEISRKNVSTLSDRAIECLIEHASHSSIVNDMAMQKLNEAHAPLRAIATSYGADPIFREKLFHTCNALSANLRTILIDQLSRYAAEDAFVYNLLSKYDQETDENVATAAAIAYAKSANRRDEITDDFLLNLDSDLRAVGLGADARRQSAFAALIELDQLEQSGTVRAKSTKNNEAAKTSDFYVYQRNHRLAAHVAEHWSRIPNMFSHSSKKRQAFGEMFLNELAVYAGPDVLEDMVPLYHASHREMPPYAFIQLCARHWHGTQRLRNLCLPLVAEFRVTSWVDAAPGIAAAEVLSRQFSHDKDVTRALQALVDEGIVSNALIIALSGQPDSDAWQKLSDQIDGSGQVTKTRPQIQLLFPAQFCLASVNLSSEELLRWLGPKMTELNGDIWDFSSACSSVVSRRFSNDKNLQQLAICHLEKLPTNAEKVNFPYFLRQSTIDLERLRGWMREEIQRQSSKCRLSDIALELSTGTIRSVSHVLLEYMS